MNYQDFEIDEIPYWCRNCNEPVSDMFALPEPIDRDPKIPIYQVCQTCYNELCNEALEKVREQQRYNEPIQDWVKRCNEVSEK